MSVLGSVILALSLSFGGQLHFFNFSSKSTSHPCGSVDRLVAVLNELRFEGYKLVELQRDEIFI